MGWICFVRDLSAAALENLLVSYELKEKRGNTIVEGT